MSVNKLHAEMTLLIPTTIKLQFLNQICDKFPNDTIFRIHREIYRNMAKLEE